MSQTLEHPVGLSQPGEREHAADSDVPTIWGLTPVQLHDRFWASRGICVVRQGERFPASQGAELYMLTDAHTLAIFSIADAVDRLYWVKPTVLFVRLRGPRKPVYREHIDHDEGGRFKSFARSYAPPPAKTANIALTSDRTIAERWQMASGHRSAWRAFRQATRQVRREVFVTDGRHFDRRRLADLDSFAHQLVERWSDPGSTIDTISEAAGGVWSAASSDVPQPSMVHGRVWVGRGRELPVEQSIIGPAVLWDAEPPASPTDPFNWELLDPTRNPQRPRVSAKRASAGNYRMLRRVFDVLFASAALLLTLPLYPFLMLAIWLEDGRPFFFAHRRETLGGREFPCLKFRTMRRDAHELRAKLQAENEADGPQFFIRDDPRVTRVGRFLRASNLDEIPQFINVLWGHMSVVGPRPSPRHENQGCPEWREMRLSVKPGITGLWQVSRTRRLGLDFQEWIRFDVEYVERANFLLDLKIIVKTVVRLLRP